MGETSAPYNEHCLPMADRRNITICTYFRPTVRPARGITLFAGDDTLIGFFRALNAALAAQPYDIVHAHSVHVALFFLMASSLRWGKYMSSTVYTMHSSYPNYKLRNKLMAISAFAFFRRVVCCSQASFESFPSWFRRLAGDRLCAIPNGLDIDRVDRVIKGSPIPCHPDSFTVASVGRLIKVKNPHSVLRAFHHSDDRAGRLVFVGEGYLRDALMSESSAYGIDGRMEVTGLIPREKVYERLMQADMYISTSRIEGLPVAVLEAMACRRPVLLSDIPAHREIAAGADFIPLIQPDDVEGFAREIERFRQMSASERASIGEQCRKIVEERFSLTIMHQRYEAVYAQVLGGHYSEKVPAFT